MDPTRRAWMIASYAIVILMLLVAFGFTLAYTMGDSLHLPFKM